jgi:phospho-N-acetylmuramoyl-pentapeptide-transferase
MGACSMTDLLWAGAIAFAVAVVVTPVLIRVFARRGWAEVIRDVGPTGSGARSGTPTMGGLAILVALWAGYWGAHLPAAANHSGPMASGLLVLGLATTLGLVGMLDETIKLSTRRSLGLTTTGKVLGQCCAAAIFALLALRYPDRYGLTPASPTLSFVRDITIWSLGGAGLVIVCCLAVLGWSNAVQLTDDVDGMAAGAMAVTLGAYLAITFWQYATTCQTHPGSGCYAVRDPLDMAIVCAAGVGASVGFLWWNTPPARIFLGETGSLALGGLLAGISVTTRTELLMPMVGALFVAESGSVLIQVLVFRSAKRRVFRMAPLHHHFELQGWKETTIIVRFWLLALISAALGTWLFFNQFFSAAN